MPSPLTRPLSASPRVYLAGPAVFRPDAVEFGRRLKAKCERAGLTGCFPLDNKIEAATRHERAEKIYRANIALIDTAAAIIADISPFRGPNMDPGTAWEIGYGIARQLPVFAWTDDPADLLTRTKAGTARKVGDRWVDGAGWAIEDFGLAENLMIGVSCVSLHASDDEAISACAGVLLART